MLRATTGRAHLPRLGLVLGTTRCCEKDDLLEAAWVDLVDTGD